MGEEEMILSVSLALFASVFCFVKIYFCDKWSDSLTAGLERDEADEPDTSKMTPTQKDLFGLKQKILDTVIDANGILVGFAWERCFDTAVKDLSDEVEFATNNSVPKTTTRVILACFCAGIIVPAWRWFILPMYIQNGWRTGVVIENEDRMERLVRLFNTWDKEVNEEIKERMTE